MMHFPHAQKMKGFFLAKAKPLTIQPLHVFPPPIDGPVCDCTGINDTGMPGRDSICRDPRLGPKVLPRRCPDCAIDSAVPPRRIFWLNGGMYTSNGKWRYPEENGFLLDADGLPIMGNLSLAVGTTVDRFGSEQGACIWTHNFHHTKPQLLSI